MGHIKTTEEGEKNLYYSRQCQLVWHAAVSPTHLPIHKKNKTYSHLMASHWVISHHKQLACSLACPVTCGTRTGDTEEPGDSRISTTISLCCRKPACGAKKKQPPPQMLNIQRSSTRTLKERHMYSQSHPLFPLHPSLLSSHLVWSKAFPAHLLSPVRWLSNKFCYLVASRWESEQNLFRKSPRFWSQQSCSLRFVSRKPPWKAPDICEMRLSHSNRQKAALPDIRWWDSGTVEKLYTFIYYSSLCLWPICGLRQSLKVKVCVF